MTDQLLREWPPGYGGVERVAHELASVWGGVVWSLDVQSQRGLETDALPVSYCRRSLLRSPSIGRLVFPLPSLNLWQLLNNDTPLHGHLPSPGVLLILLLSRLLRPRRRVTAHWHSFIEPRPSLSGCLFAIYQWLALLFLPRLSGVITTSPSLAQELVSAGCQENRLNVLPCCLSALQEQELLRLPLRQRDADCPIRILFIGRLDSYKRLDWLLESLSILKKPWKLTVVGDGPKRTRFEAISSELLGVRALHCVSFLGRLSEQDKHQQIARADLLVLPSDRSNEAFGIVQLEAMAAGIPSLAFHRRFSGMGWVGRLPSLDWSQTPEDLPDVLQRLSSDFVFCRNLGEEARDRYCHLFSRKVWLQHLSAIY